MRFVTQKNYMLNIKKNYPPNVSIYFALHTHPKGKNINHLSKI